MDFAIIIQARMSSTRLPGKSLMPFGDKPLLLHQIERLRESKYGEFIIVATSDEKDDDPIAKFCEENEIPVVRGPLEDVAGRFVKALKTYSPKSFARFCADRPWYDYRLLDEAVALKQTSGADIVSNVSPGSFPKGQTTEIIETNVYLNAYSSMKEQEDLEHVTRYFYQNPDEFKIVRFKAVDESFKDINLCIDTEEDYKKANLVLEELGSAAPECTWLEIASAYRKDS